MSTIALVSLFGFSVTLSVGDILTVAGIGATAAGIAFGLYQMRQAASARLEARTARALLLKQQVSQHFSSAAAKALLLYRVVSDRAWKDSRETALLLSGDLATAAGFPIQLVGESHRAEVVEAVSALGSVMAAISSSEEVFLASHAEIQSACQATYIIVSGIEGSLRMETALGGDE